MADDVGSRDRLIDCISRPSRVRFSRDQHRPGDRKLVGADPQIGPTGKGCDGGEADQQPEDGQCNMGIGIARPHHHPIVAVQQQKTVETIGPGFHREEEPQQSGAMSDGRG